MLTFPLTDENCFLHVFFKHSKRSVFIMYQEHFFLVYVNVWGTLHSIILKMLWKRYFRMFLNIQNTSKDHRSVTRVTHRQFIIANLPASCFSTAVETGLAGGNPHRQSSKSLLSREPSCCEVTALPTEPLCCSLYIYAYINILLTY